MSRLDIDLDLLSRFDVSGLETIYAKTKKWYVATDENVGFFYRIGRGEKAYMPFNMDWDGKARKFYHQHLHQPEGWAQLPPGQLGDVIITKSLKDVMALTVAGFHAVSAPSESMANHMMSFLPILSQRCNTIGVWGDPDQQGEAYSKEIMDMITQIRGSRGVRKITSQLAKDPSDIRMLTGDYEMVRRLALAA